MLWTPQALPWLIVAAALLVLAGVIFSRQRASRVAVLFCAMIVLVAVWFAAFGAMFLAADADVAVRLGRLGLAGVALLPAAIDDFPMFGVRMRPLGYVPVVAFIAVAWTAILRHRLAPITAARAAREILETMADALFVLDAEGCIRVINGAVRTLLGYTHADLLGRSIDTLEVMSGDATISRTLREISRRGAIRDQERLLRHKDGHPIDVSISISPVSEVNVQEGAVVIARDIRERKRAEEELHSAMRRLEQSNRELEDFAYVASHDLQEPLRKIQAFGDRLKAKHAEELAPPGRDYIDRMQAAAKRMQILIN